MSTSDDSKIITEPHDTHVVLHLRDLTKKDFEFLIENLNSLFYNQEGGTTPPWARAVVK